MNLETGNVKQQVNMRRSFISLWATTFLVFLVFHALLLVLASRPLGGPSMKRFGEKKAFLGELSGD